MSSIPTTPYIVIDQFGYRPDAEKIAYIRNPKKGYDVPSTAYTPSGQYAVEDATSGTKVATVAPAAWSNGATDEASGDQVWRVTFTSVKTPGEYVLVDLDNNLRSYPFMIDANVYADLLKAAVRMMYYQRSGIAKEAKYAGDSWADDMQFAGDQKCQRFLNKDSSTEKDLSGGWYDAGDYNKYTNWSAGYVLMLLRTFSENPAAFGDDTKIPESGNGIPDIIDETLWELEWLKKMQDGAGSDGSVLSVVGEVTDSNGTTSPPSKYQGKCYYGDASTSATLRSAAAFAYAAKVLKDNGIDKPPSYTDDLLSRAAKAWTWAQANPAVYFLNNNSDAGTSGLAAGQQEFTKSDSSGKTIVDTAAFPPENLASAAILFASTGEDTYKTFFDTHYKDSAYATATGGWVGPWDAYHYEAILSYTLDDGATASVVSDLKSAFKSSILGGDNLAAYSDDEDAYGAYLAQYTWGSNAVKAAQGLVFTYIPTYGLDASSEGDAALAAERFVHYFHGANPMNEVYLSNMGSYGAGKSVTKFFHTWFFKGTDWSEVGVSKYGPAPGYLVGGPNPSYSLDGCCPSSCGSADSNALCVNPVPPANQPSMKSYKDMNDGWPVDSWSVSEPSVGYQVQYIHLLSKFVAK